MGLCRLKVGYKESVNSDIKHQRFQAYLHRRMQNPNDWQSAPSEKKQRLQNKTQLRKYHCWSCQCTFTLDPLWIWIWVHYSVSFCFVLNLPPSTKDQCHVQHAVCTVLYLSFAFWSPLTLFQRTEATTSFKEPYQAPCASIWTSILSSPRGHSIYTYRI